ncbi:MAG: NADH-quinone oxidoreductase subunit C, partial [Myxococcota bacterium]
YKGHEGPRFMVVYHFYSTTKAHRIRIKVPLEADDVTMPSMWPVFPGVDWFEREVFDMFGVIFEGHHDLRRILLYPEFKGYPLRKDYPLRGYQPLVPIARLDPDNEDPKLVDQDLNPEAPHE